jgi:hypothetical protein
MELLEMLAARKAELAKAPVEKRAEIEGDIKRISEAIISEKEMRASILPPEMRACGATAKAVREARALELPAEPKPELTEAEKTEIRQAFREGKCRINGDVVEVDI